MKKAHLIFIISLCLFCQQNLFAQIKDTIGLSLKKDSTNKINDSLNSIILQKFNQQKIETEQLRIADSITKSNLENEIRSLKTTDNLKKQELEKQLLELRDKEALRFAEKKKQIDSLRLTAKGYPVLGFFKDTLFYVYNKSGSFSAEDRANAITGRIKKLADYFRFAPDSISISHLEASTDLSFKDITIISISDNDALWNNNSRDELADYYRIIIGEEVLKYNHATSFRTLAKEIGLALLVILIVILIIKYISKLFRFIRVKIRQQKDKKIKGIRIKNYTLLDSAREVSVFLRITNFIKWLLIIVVIYLALPILFGIFPWTKNFADTLFGYVINPVKNILKAFWNFLPNLITILVILFVFKYIFRSIKYLKNEVKNENLKIPGFFPDWANPTYQIIRVLVFAFMVVVIYPYLPGSGSPVFQCF